MYIERNPIKFLKLLTNPRARRLLHDIQEGGSQRTREIQEKVEDEKYKKAAERFMDAIKLHEDKFRDKPDQNVELFHHKHNLLTRDIVARKEKSGSTIVSFTSLIDIPLSMDPVTWNVNIRRTVINLSSTLEVLGIADEVKIIALNETLTNKLPLQPQPLTKKPLQIAALNDVATLLERSAVSASQP